MKVPGWVPQTLSPFLKGWDLDVNVDVDVADDGGG